MAKILLVEEDLFLQDIYKETLEEVGMSVTLAGDGEEALKKMSEGGWDLVLLDVIMPKMSGIEVLKNLKLKNPHTLAKKIVLMSNSEEARTVEEVRTMSDGYIIKSSYTPDQLVSKIKEFL